MSCLHHSAPLKSVIDALIASYIVPASKHRHAATSASLESLWSASLDLGLATICTVQLLRLLRERALTAVNAHSKFELMSVF